MRVLFLSITAGLAMLSATAAFATDGARSAIIRGRADVIMTSRTIRLEHIADITGENNDSVLALKRIDLGPSPAPGATQQLKAESIVASLKGHGIDLEKVGYLLPPVIKINRASRPLTESEVRAAVEQELTTLGREIALKEVKFSPALQVYSGDIQLAAKYASQQAPGQVNFAIVVRSGDGEEMTFDARAMVDEWKSFPVAVHPLKAGTVLSGSDIVMARLNASQLPKDAALSSNDLVGLKLQREIGIGEAFRLTNIEIPPVVETGTRVVVVYNSGSLRATATGTALEDGRLGQAINVKNDASKKLIRGIVKEAGIVEVTQ